MASEERDLWEMDGDTRSLVARELDPEDEYALLNRDERAASYATRDVLRARIQPEIERLRAALEEVLDEVDITGELSLQTYKHARRALSPEPAERKEGE